MLRLTYTEGSIRGQQKGPQNPIKAKEQGNLKCLKNGPMFLSDTESDSDDHDDTDVLRRNRMPPVREPQSLKESFGYNGPPPPYTVERTSGPSIISLDLRQEELCRTFKARTD